MEQKHVRLDAAVFAAMVDHTLLKPEATHTQVTELCTEARALQTAAVCTNGLWTPTVAAELTGSGVKVCSVVGFPLGAMSAAALAAETADAVDAGAAEIDMVVAVGHLKARDDRAAAALVDAARTAAGPTTLKVILESALLDDDEIVRACRLSVDSGADFVKTSTGFNPAGGATAHAVALMRATVGPNIGVKASGGLRTLADVDTVVAAGANRLGMSATAAVVGELRARSGH